MTTLRRRIWGWFFFDWASQPYNTLLLTFIFAPYVKDLVGDGTKAQVAWGYGIGLTGIVIAVLAPFLGSVADRGGPRTRLRFIWLFSLMYVAGASGLWFSSPESFSLWSTLIFFAVGLIGMEFATIFTNAMLPGLARREDIGAVSGSGWAFGYLGGLVALVLMLTLFAENASTGQTMIGRAPALGLDPATREGTRAVGPFTAIWYLVFMIPFFLWVREPRSAVVAPLSQAIRAAWPDLRAKLAELPGRPSLFAFLVSSLFYRDALNGIYFFGGIYAAGVLGWSVVNVGIFGILAVTSGAIFAFLGGRADRKFGPKPVIMICIVALSLLTLGAVFVARDAVFGVAVPAVSRAPDIAFYLIGAGIGAAGGALQASSRTMMVWLIDPAQATQGFGLYALAGKATAFIAPLAVALATDLSGSQQMGIVPLIVLFLLGLVLLVWVRADGDRPA